MATIKPVSILGKRLLMGAMCSVFTLSNAAMSQTSNTSGGPKFQKVGERGNGFRNVPKTAECDFISHNVRFCTSGTDWVLEREPIHGEQALYQLSGDRRASFTVIVMEEDASRNLTPAEVMALLDQRIFADGPRGQMIVETTIAEKMVPNGRILHRRVLVRDTADQVRLLQVTVLPLDYGLGFLETTIALSSTVEASQISDEQIAFHGEFLKSTRISTSMK